MGTQQIVKCVWPDYAEDVLLYHESFPYFVKVRDIGDDFIAIRPIGGALIEQSPDGGGCFLKSRFVEGRMDGTQKS